MAVVRLLNCETLPSDIWLYNATQLTLDMLEGCHVSFTWVSRDENGVCDQLARTAVSSAGITLSVHPDWEV